MPSPGGNSRGQSVYVPLNHWAYDFIERLEAKHVLQGVLNGTKPLSRREMAKYLGEALRKAEAGYQFTQVEQEQLEFLKVEFREELAEFIAPGQNGYQTEIARIKRVRWIDRLLPNLFYRNDRNFLSFEREDFRLHLDPILFHDRDYSFPDTLNSTEKVYQTGTGLTFWGTLGDHIGFSFDTRDTKEWGTRAYPDTFNITREGLGFVNGYGTYIFHDETDAYVVFKLPYFQFQLGKAPNRWGPGHRGNLGLSNHATSYDQLKLQFQVWRLKFTNLLAFLRAYPPVKEGGNLVPKSLAAHRLEISPVRGLDIGLQETVVYARRRFELAYANPIMFYRSAEHYLGSPDNATLGGDIEITLLRSLKLYGEFFIDDLYIARLGTGWWGNKLGWLGGALWVDALGVDNLDVRLEYARVEPYVYSHEGGPLSSYSHFNTILGYWSGPNSDNLSGEWTYRFSKQTVATLLAEYFRHGANPPDRNVGGDFYRTRVGTDSEYLHFLDGIVERRARLRAELSHEIFRNFFVRMAFETTQARNVLRPDGSRGNATDIDLQFTMALNY